MPLFTALRNLSSHAQVAAGLGAFFLVAAPLPSQAQLIFLMAATTVQKGVEITCVSEIHK